LNNLVDFTKLAHGIAIESKASKVKLMQLMREIFNSMGQISEKKKIALTIDGRNAPYHVIIDKTRFA